MAITIPSSLTTAIIEGAASAGAGLAIAPIFTQITNLLHPQVAAAAASPASTAATPEATPPNINAKQITVGWATANPTLVPLYMAAGYTIIPGK